jgi:multicomponent Na+:H+ antiporter subunit G
MSVLALLQTVLIGAGVAFFVIGSIGVLRFPDVYTRIHALTKADNLGLGLIVLGLLPGADSPAAALKLLLIWILALLASACAGYLVARAARQRGIRPWQRDGGPAAVEDGR